MSEGEGEGFSMALKLPGQQTTIDKAYAVVKRSPGLPSTVIARRLGVSNEVVGVALDVLAQSGKLLKHKVTDPDSYYWNHVVYYLPQSQQ